MDPQLQQQALEAQAQAGQAGLKAFSDAQTAIEAQKKSAVDAALKEAALRGSPVASQEQIAATIGGAADRRLADINQAQATFTADNSRRQQSLNDYFSKVRGGETLIQQEGQQKRDTLAAQLAADISRLQHEGDQARQTSQMDFENKMQLAQLQFAMQQASRSGGGSKLSADQQLAAIQQAARENLQGQVQGYQAQAQQGQDTVTNIDAGSMDALSQALDKIDNERGMAALRAGVDLPAFTPTPAAASSQAAALQAQKDALRKQVDTGTVPVGSYGSKEAARAAALKQLDALTKQIAGAKSNPAPVPVDLGFLNSDSGYQNALAGQVPQMNTTASQRQAAQAAYELATSQYQDLLTNPSYLTNEMLRIGQGAGVDPTVLGQLSPGFKVGQSLGDILGIEQGVGTLAQQQAAAEKAQKDAATATKDQSAAELAAVRDQVSNTTGRDLQKIASDAKVTEPAAASVIGSQDFQTAVRAIQSTVQTRDDLESWLQKNTDAEPVFRALLRSWFADALS